MIDMIEITREEFTTDKAWNQLFQMIKKHHKVGQHTEKVLRDNKHVNDFCAITKHFATIVLGPATIHHHYVVESWWKEPDGVRLKFTSICVYDNVNEYQQAREKAGLVGDISNVN